MKAFDTIDMDNNGYISRTELMKVMLKLGFEGISNLTKE